MRAKWFLGNHDVDELISLVERRMKSMDEHLAEVVELLKKMAGEEDDNS